MRGTFWVQSCDIWGAGAAKDKLGRPRALADPTENALSDLTFPQCLLTFSLVGRGFPRVFDVSAFRFLVILCQGLGHHFGSCLASPVPLWATLVPLSTSFGLSLGCLDAQKRLKSESSLIWRTLAKHAPACTDCPLRPTPKSTETEQTSRVPQKHTKCTEGAPREPHERPKRRQGYPREPKRRPHERKRRPRRSIVAPWPCPTDLKPTLWTFHCVKPRPTQSSTTSPSGRPKSAERGHRCPRELQEGPQSAPRTPHKEYSGAWAPQNGTKIEVQSEPKNV